MSLQPRDLIGLSGTFLGDLGYETVVQLLEDARLIEVPRDGSLFGDGPSLRSGVLLEGTVRAYLPMPDGTQLTLRYNRAGSLITNTSSRASGAPVAIRFVAVTDCSLIEMDVARMQELREAGRSINAAATEELARRLEDVYRSYAATVHGTMRERLATHLLECAEPQLPGPLFAPATQRELADAIGTRREVVSRALAEMARDGLIKTGRGGVRILSPARLVRAAGRWWNPSRLAEIDISAGPSAAFDRSRNAVVGIDMKGEVVYANAQVEQTFGWPVSQMIGLPITDMLPPDVVKPFRQMFDSYMADVQPGPIGLGARFHGRRADGTEFPAQITIVPAQSSAGIAVFAVVIDVSYVQALRDHLDELARARP